MNMKTNRILLILASVCVLGLTSCREQFAEMNQSPSAVTNPDPSYMATRCQLLFEFNDYTYWFYNQALYNRWSQMGSNGAYSEGSNAVGTAVNWQGNYTTMLTYRNDINNYIEAFEAYENSAYAAMCGTLAAFQAIYASDIQGDIQYTEACQYKYGGTLTPKYDKVEDLYNILLDELDGYVATFQDPTQVVVAKQDIIFNGNLAKWARLANTIKLKIAVRLYLNNPDKAKQIASAVVGSSAGYIDTLEDAFIFHKADASTGGDLAYQTGNSLSGWMGGASGNVINFMRNSLDPRLRFFYTKNSFNSKIVQCFIDNDMYDSLPSYIKEVVVRDEDGNFKSWGGPGEPWVRYFGYPIVFQGSDEYKALIGEYYEYADRYKVSVGDANKTYGIYSAFQEEMVRGRCGFGLPTVPGGPVIQDNEQVPWWGMYLGAGETNLYLAELAQLGASLPKSAEAYYNRGVELSVTEWDYIAGKNKIPYYGTTYNYDPEEVSIELKDGEIAAMLATDAVKFGGSDSEKLEKIYLQELMNFNMMPNDLFVTAKRSGYPKIGSKLLPFVKFKEIELTAIPRRFEFATPLITDVMHDLRLESLQSQGFTPGTAQSGMGFSSTSVLNTERLWQDKNAPQWGSAK